MIELKSNYGTDIGLKRKSNNDALLIDQAMGLYIVCDGVGENPGSQAIAKGASQYVRQFIEQHKNLVEDFKKSPSPQTRQAVSTLLVQAIQSASMTLFEETLQNQELAGGATTLDLLLVAGDHAFIGHVGDSRVYLFRGGKAHQITEDHNYYTQLTTKENKTHEEAKRHLFSSALTQSLGRGSAIEPDVIEVELAHQDSFLLCSDGIYRHFTQAQLVELAVKHGGQIPVQLLIDEGKKRGGQDNLTGIFVCALRKDASTPSKKGAEVNQKLESLQKMPLFQYMTYQDLLRILSVATYEVYPEGEVLMTEGEKADSMCLITQGQVAIKKKGQQVAEITSGGTIGEMSLIENLARSATAVAQTEVHALYFARQTLFSLFRKEEGIAVKFFWCLSRDLTQRLRQTTTDLVQTKSDLDAIKKELPFSQSRPQ